MFWPQQSFESLKTAVLSALNKNASFYDHNIMGLPATYLDPHIFPADADFLSNAPFIRSFIENPNHIGLHTYDKSIPSFHGTQQLELDLLRICAEEIFKAKPNSYDGYVSPGGVTPGGDGGEPSLDAIYSQSSLFCAAQFCFANGGMNSGGVG